MSPQRSFAPYEAGERFEEQGHLFGHVVPLPGLATTIYTSYGHAPTPGGTCYRAVVALSHRVRPNAYRAIVHLIRDQIERTKWCRFDPRKGASPSTRYHGIDGSKDHAASIFYLPTRRAGHEADHWIEHHDGEPLDVVEWLAKDMSRVIPEDQIIRPPTPEASPTTIDRLLSASGRDAAIARYFALAGGTQDYGLNQLAWSLAVSGMDEGEIRDVLAACRTYRDAAAGVRLRAADSPRCRTAAA